jgi:hypothetical protein
MMTLLRLRTGTARRATTEARSEIETRPAAQHDVYDLLDEIGAWLLFAGLSLTGWLVAAVAFDLV